MWPYWVFFFLPALAAAVSPPSPLDRNGRARRPDIVPLSLMGVALTLFIGYRYEVGADWLNYFAYLQGVEGLSLAEVLDLSDPGYQIVNWLSVQLGWGLIGVNLIVAGIFTLGLFRFCCVLPRAWLALAVATPYLVIVVGMGYTRQAAALGCTMIGITVLGKRSTFGFVAWVLLGATFHKTAVLLLPIAALASAQNRIWTALWVGVVTLGAYWLFLQESVDSLYANYVENQYQSQGAMIRLVMNSLPALALLRWWKKFRSVGVAVIWRWFAVISLVLQATLLVSPSSTAVDRVALYMLPLQLIVFGHWPEAFGSGRAARGPLTFVLAYYAVVQFVWLNFATHAQFWLPYRFYPLIGFL